MGHCHFNSRDPGVGWVIATLTAEIRAVGWVIATLTAEIRALGPPGDPCRVESTKQAVFFVDQRRRLGGTLPV